MHTFDTSETVSEGSETVFGRRSGRTPHPLAEATIPVKTAAPGSGAVASHARMRDLFSIRNMSQERIVFALAVLLFVVAGAALRGFLDADNLVAIVRSVSVLGILAVGMALVIIGRGIDLSAVAIMAMSVAWYLQMLDRRDARRRRPGSGAGGGARHRLPQRLPDRLCRRAGDLRDARQRLLRLRLRPLPADHAGRDAGAAGSLDRAARPLPARRRSRSRSSSSPASPSSPFCSCASPNGAATST